MTKGAALSAARGLVRGPGARAAFFAASPPTRIHAWYEHENWDRNKNETLERGVCRQDPRRELRMGCASELLKRRYLKERERKRSKREEEERRGAKDSETQKTGP